MRVLICKLPPYRDTSLLRNHPTLGTYIGPTPRALWWIQGGGLFLMNEVPLYWESVSKTASCPDVTTSHNLFSCLHQVVSLPILHPPESAQL